MVSTEPASELLAASKTAPMSKSAFIRQQPATMSVAEVVAKGRKAGYAPVRPLGQESSVDRMSTSLGTRPTPLDSSARGATGDMGGPRPRYIRSGIEAVTSSGEVT
jgi:hypothetical protein